MLIRVLVATILLFGSSSAKIYDRCELARELKYVAKLPDDLIPIWVCIARYESNYNTSAVNVASGDHGIFQISDIYWCSLGRAINACNEPCSAFEDDDIRNDLICANRIYKEHKRLSGDGFNAWVVYPNFCKGDVTKFVVGCYNATTDNLTQTTTQMPTSSGQEETDESEYEFPPLPSYPRKLSTKQGSIITNLKTSSKKLISTEIPQFFHDDRTVTSDILHIQSKTRHNLNAIAHTNPQKIDIIAKYTLKSTQIPEFSNRIGNVLNQDILSTTTTTGKPFYRANVGNHLWKFYTTVKPIILPLKGDKLGIRAAKFFDSNKEYTFERSTYGFKLHLI